MQCYNYKIFFGGNMAVNLKTDWYSSSKTCHGVLALQGLYKLFLFQKVMIYAQQQIVVPLSYTRKKKQVHPALVLETLEKIDDKKKVVEKF